MSIYFFLFCLRVEPCKGYWQLLVSRMYYVACIFTHSRRKSKINCTNEIKPLKLSNLCESLIDIAANHLGTLKQVSSIHSGAKFFCCPFFFRQPKSISKMRQNHFETVEKKISYQKQDTPPLFFVIVWFSLFQKI